MSKLQKSAWINLSGVTLSTLISMLCFAVLAKTNAKGMDYVIICILVACIITPVAYWYYKKKSIESGFDERENIIYQRAFNISAFGLVIFLGLVCIIPFFIIGGGNAIRVIYLPIIFVSAIFIAQFVHSLAIIIQCAQEEENGL